MTMPTNTTGPESIDDLLRDLSDAEFILALAHLTDAEIARSPVGRLDRIVVAHVLRARAGAPS